jgi:hypothetical protein
MKASAILLNLIGKINKNKRMYKLLIGLLKERLGFKRYHIY